MFIRLRFINVDVVLHDSRASQSKTPDTDLINYIAASVFFTYTRNKFHRINRIGSFSSVSIPSD